jgi:hypothetical protein
MVVTDLLKFWRAGRPYVLAVAIYLCSRVVVILAINFAATYLPLLPRHSPLWLGDVWQSGPRWYDHLLRWDSGWYASIATQGYHYNGNSDEQQPVGFFPLYPLLSRLVALVSGVSPFHALLLVANLAAFSPSCCSANWCGRSSATR